MKNFIQVQLFVRGNMMAEVSCVALTLLDYNFLGLGLCLEHSTYSINICLMNSYKVFFSKHYQASLL